MLIQWDRELLWNFYIDSSRNVSVLYNPVLQVMGFFFDLQHILGISTFWKPSHPLFCTQASVSWGSAFDGSLGHSGGTLSTFLLWPKLLASSGLLTHCGGPVYPRVFLWAWCSGAGFCSLLCFAHLKQDLSAHWPCSQPSPWPRCGFSKGPVGKNWPSDEDAHCDWGFSEFYSLIPAPQVAV